MNMTNPKARKNFKRRASIEPKIGHLKQDHRFSKNFYKGIIGDQINVLLACSAMNFKRMMNKWKSEFVFFVHIVFYSSSFIQAKQLAFLQIDFLRTDYIIGDSSICLGDSSILNTGSFAQYLWSTSSSLQTISVSTSGTYFVTVTDTNGCTGTASKTVTVNPNPTPYIIGDSSICSGNSTMLMQVLIINIFGTIAQLHKP